MPRIVEHFYAVIRYRDGIEYESRAFLDYDSARNAAVEEVQRNPRGIRHQTESFRIEHRWDTYDD